MKGCRPLTDHEVALIAGSFTGQYVMRNRALFLLGVRSGFRISELLSLRLKDVFRCGQIIARVSVNRRSMKRKTEGRTVLLHPQAKEALHDWIEEFVENGYSDANGYVFRSRNGSNKPISALQAWRILRHAYQSNGLTGKLGTHSMRKTFAAKVYQRLSQRRAAGEPVDPFRLTSKALGHRNLNSTDAYLSFLEEDIDEAILAA